jgi:NADH-quinone oxidoreductase subunit K
MNGVPLAAYIGLSMFMFSTGVAGVIIRRNPIVIFMCIELMLNAVNLAFLSFARYRFAVVGHSMDQAIAGPMMVIFVMAVAAAEVAVGLGIIMAIYRLKEEVDVDELNLIGG